MLHIFFSILPFLVSLWWLIRFACIYRVSDKAKRTMTWFLLTDTTLYFCHAYYFIFDFSQFFEGLWVLCSLSVYPLFYQYICQLSSEKTFDWRKIWIFLPAFISATCIWMGAIATGQMIHKAVFSIQVLYVAISGYKKLKTYDQELLQVYADTNKIDTRPLRNLLLCFVIFSFCSAIFNILGKQVFHDSEWLVIIPSVFYSTMIFSLCMVVFKQKFVANTLSLELQDDSPKLPEASGGKEEINMQAMAEKIAPIIQRLMEEEHFYLKQDIKISDLAREIGTCRTYLSKYLNQELGVSFSDYINKQRIEYAKQLLREEEKTMRMDQIAFNSGFSSEVSFYRNFKKFASMTPEEWVNKK